MIIRYRLFESPDEHGIDIETFPEFLAWLLSMGVGQQEADPKVLSWRAEDYRKLATGQCSVHRYTRSRVSVGAWIEIVELGPLQA